jgi:hypothetical protein
MAEADLPSSWSGAGRLALGHSIWILPLVVTERLVEGHFYQALCAAGAWVAAVFIALQLNVLQEFIGNSKRQRQLFTWALIIIGGALLSWGIYRLAVEPRQNSPDVTALQDQLRAERDAKASLEKQLAETNQALQDIQQRTRAATPTPPVLPAGERQFTNKTIRQLRAIYEGRTALQAKAFMADEVGKWIDTEGDILRVDEGLLFLTNENDHIECRLGPQWTPKLATYRNGERVRVRGQIGPNQNGAQIYLFECEIRD